MAYYSADLEAHECDHKEFLEVAHRSDRETVLVCKKCGSVFSSVCLYGTELLDEYGPYHWLKPGESLGTFSFPMDDAQQFLDGLVHRKRKAESACTTQ